MPVTGSVGSGLFYQCCRSFSQWQSSFQMKAAQPLAERFVPIPRPVSWTIHKATNLVIFNLGFANSSILPGTIYLVIQLK